MKNGFKILIFFMACLVLTAVFYACDNKKGEEEQPPVVECSHTFGEWEYVSKPTETSGGLRYKTCSACETKDYQELPQLSVNDYEKTTVKSTCVSDGKNAYHSDIYGDYVVTLPRLNHTYSEIKRTAATCTEDGTVTYKCNRCGYEYTEITEEADGHEYIIIETIEPTCTTKGYSVCVCKKCSDRITINETDFCHEYGNGNYTVGDCTHYGYTEYECRLCGHKNIVYDTEYTHNYNKDTGKCDTCGKVCAHNFENYVCKVCGLNIYEQLDNNGYFHVDENENGDIDMGETIYFGTYPQSYVSDASINVALKNLSADENGYYSYDGKKYVRSTLTQNAKAFLKFSDGSFMEDVNKNAEDYFYLVEPIAWTVNGFDDDGNVLITAQSVLDAAVYQTGFIYSSLRGDYFTTDESGAITEHFADEWEESDLRSMLNGAFCDRAFSATQKNIIVEKYIDNSDSNYHNSGKYTKCEDTLDKVFALAYKELFDESEAYDDKNDDRVKKASDYALGSGIIILDFSENTVIYYTRSVGSKTNYVCGINTDGTLERSLALSKNYGVVPSLYLHVGE